MTDEFGETIDDLLQEYDRLIHQLPYGTYIRYIADTLGRLTDDWRSSLDEAFIELARSTLAAFNDSSVPDPSAVQSASLAWTEMDDSISSRDVDKSVAGLSQLFMVFMQEMAGTLSQKESGQLLAPLFDEQAWRPLGDRLEQYDASVRPDLQVKETQMVVREISIVRSLTS
jgi:hypothetical protein